MDTQLSMMCCWEGPHQEPTPYNAIYIFFFELKKWYKLQTIYVLNLEVESMPKNGNLDLQDFIKTEIENFE